MQAMEFITLTSGATSMSSRSEVADTIVAEIRKSLGSKLRGKLWAGWSVIIDTTAPGAACFLLLLHDIILSRCAVCWDAAVSDGAWEIVQDAVPDKVVVHRPRGVPWLAVDLQLSAVLQHPDRLLQLADAERCVAWALIEGATDGR
jgi:hypothetical protein